MEDPYRMTRRSTCSNTSSASRDDHHDGRGPSTPPLLSSPSAGSSICGISSVASPLRRLLSHSSLHDEPDNLSTSSSRLALARRLSHLAQQLTNGDGVVDDLALTRQIDQMEKAMAQPPSRPKQPPQPGSLEVRSHSDPGTSLASSPAFSLTHPRFSELSAPIMPRELGAEPDLEKMHKEPRSRMPARQTNRVIAEAAKLNEELSVVVSNLRARQEESDHIQSLLVERAERAAQRIIFLQNRIAYLEQELNENDDELQHLRICLKAVEIQMPPNPDHELERCIATFKEDYRALKQKRTSHNASASGYGSVEFSHLDMY